MENGPSAAIALFVTVGLGLFVWGFSLSQTSLQASSLSEQTGAAILQERSNLAIENVAFQGDKIYIRLYNIGFVDLQIVSITASKTAATYDFQDWGTLEVQQSKLYVLTGKREPGLNIRVHALATFLFHETDPSTNIQWGVSRVWTT